MKNQGNDIREILDDMKDIMGKMAVNESFAFGEKMPPSQGSKPVTSPIEKQMPTEDINSELEPTSNIEEPTKHGNIDEKVKQIRKVAIETLSDLDPTVDPDSYKMIKSIWDSCDKYLTKDNAAKPKEQNTNNI